MWIYRVGMPAKSGVSGGILAVLPRPAWHRCFFPRFDPWGNSVRGVKFCREISAEFYLHMFNAPQISTTVLHRRTFLGEVFSNRLRSEDDRKSLSVLAKASKCC